ncbi:MAG: hypothetical protein ACRDNJ_06045, partial [Solirubrobacteraceae bacterium]
APLSLMAGAAAAEAAGDPAAAGRLRTRALAQAQDTSTYYGDAWAALGPALLNGTIAPCAHAAGVSASSPS